MGSGRNILRYGLLASALIFTRVAITAHNILTDVTLGAGECVEIAADPGSGTRSFEISAALSGNRNSNGLGNASWWLEWCNNDGMPMRRISMRWGNECLGDPLDRRFLRVTVDSISPAGHPLTLASNDLYDGIDLYGGFNTLSVEESLNGNMRLWVGNDLEYFVGECDAWRDAAIVKVGCNRKLKMRYAAYSHIPDPALRLQTAWSQPEVMKYAASRGNDGIEGIWRFLDRDNDVRWARPGGLYRVAIVRSREADVDAKIGAYDILYLDGAKVNPEAWQPCMLKGRLYPTVFEGHYNLEWFDAYMVPMEEEVSAQFTDNVILSLDFPLFRSRMRFAKEVIR